MPVLDYRVKDQKSIEDLNVYEIKILIVVAENDFLSKDAKEVSQT